CRQPDRGRLTSRDCPQGRATRREVGARRGRRIGPSHLDFGPTPVAPEPPGSPMKGPLVKRFTPLLGAALLAVLVAACGTGAASQPSGPTASLTADSPRIVAKDIK